MKKKNVGGARREKRLGKLSSKGRGGWGEIGGRPKKNQNPSGELFTRPDVRKG